MKNSAIPLPRPALIAAVRNVCVWHSRHHDRAPSPNRVSHGGVPLRCRMKKSAINNTRQTPPAIMNIVWVVQDTMRGPWIGHCSEIRVVSRPYPSRALGVRAKFQGIVTITGKRLFQAFGRAFEAVTICETNPIKYWITIADRAKPVV